VLVLVSKRMVSGVDQAYIEGVGLNASKRRHMVGQGVRDESSSVNNTM